MKHGNAFLIIMSFIFGALFALVVLHMRLLALTPGPIAIIGGVLFIGLNYIGALVLDLYHRRRR